MSDPADLMEEARDAAERSYSPYSRFRVGAVVIAEDGRHFAGCNVENSAYGSSICAEANAISTAAAAGVRRITAMAVACLESAECYPCGNCRQLMREFDVAEVVVQDGAEGFRTIAFADLLPHSFGPEHLPDR
jgi:cytidine deaminase